MIKFEEAKRRLNDVHVLTDDEVKRILRMLLYSVHELEKEVEELKEQINEQSAKH